MRGMVSEWGDKKIFGWLVAHGRTLDVNETVREWASIHATWSEEPRRLNCTEPPTENFTFVFYSARNVNTTALELNYSGYNLYVSGLWNVAKVTTTIKVDENGDVLNVTRTVVPILTEAEGELHVLANWHQFELSINGIEILSGLVHGTIIRYVEIKICDVNDDDKVDLIDLVRVARRYQTLPGLFNYDHNMDFNCNDEIDIGDLTTLAANIDV